MRSTESRMASIVLSWRRNGSWLPVVISNGVSKPSGTTDLFHMLSNRIVAWDKWNYPATDAVLKALGGGTGVVRKATDLVFSQATIRVISSRSNSSALEAAG